MPRARSGDLAVGSMFALALIILALTIMAVGGESRLFVAKHEYVVNFPNAEGLAEGSPVKMAGVQVGTVTSIQLSTDPAAGGIEVHLGVDRAYAGRVREDARAALRILQILSGEKYVEIIPGSPESPELPSGSRIQPSQDTEILEQAAVAAENINEISVSLRNILDALEQGKGLMGQMITNPDFGKEGLEALVGSFKNLEKLTADLRAGKGLMGRLLEDEDVAAKLDDLGQAITDLRKLIASIDTDSGAIGALVQEGGAGHRAVEDMAEAAASLKRITQRLESEQGLLGRLLNDEEYSEGVATDLKTLTGNLAEISEKINRGDGTLGALVNSRVLYDGMEDVVAGVNDSKFARWMMRHYQKKGIVAQEEAAEEQRKAAADDSEKDDPE